MRAWITPKTKGYSQENIDSLETSKNETHRREYKSSRSFMMSASEDTVLNVQSQSVQLNTAAGSVKRVEDLSQDIRNIASIDRVRSQVQSNSQAVNAGSSADVQIGNITDTSRSGCQLLLETIREFSRSTTTPARHLTSTAVPPVVTSMLRPISTPP